MPPSLFSSSNPTTPPPPNPFLLPSGSIPQTAVHLRPVRIEDLPQCWAIHSYWVLNHVTNMYHVPWTFGRFRQMYDDAVESGLPFIVAVYRPREATKSGEAEALGRAGSSSASLSSSSPFSSSSSSSSLSSSSDGAFSTGAKDTDGDAAGSDPELIMGYAYLQPNFPEELGHALYLCGQNTYVHPSVHISGIGTRLSVLICNLAKAPQRYTQRPSPSCSSTSMPFKHPELDPSTYRAFRGLALRPINAILRRTVVDEHGVGKGKSRFFEKLGYREVGYVPRAGVKWGRVYGMRYWYLELCEWDEVRGCWMGRKREAKL